MANTLIASGKDGIV